MLFQQRGKWFGRRKVIHSRTTLFICGHFRFKTVSCEGREGDAGKLLGVPSLASRPLRDVSKFGLNRLGGGCWEGQIPVWCL